VNGAADTPPDADSVSDLDLPADGKNGCFGRSLSHEQRVRINSSSSVEHYSGKSDRSLGAPHPEETANRTPILSQLQLPTGLVQKITSGVQWPYSRTPRHYSGDEAPHRRCRAAGPDLGVRGSSRLVATAAGTAAACSAATSTPCGPKPLSSAPS
jgi:hypothetical protein